jgi:chemotaxis protein CheY-P-specific phosphatase CheC
MTSQIVSEVEIDRLRELAHVGASWAATALAQLANATILTRVPLVYGPDRFRVRSDWSTGIFCDFGGALSGTVGIFLTAAGRDQVLRMLCGSDDLSIEQAASVLSEFGNILSSQTVSAMSGIVGGVILPGLPELVRDQAESVFAARLAPRDRPSRPLYIESELFDRAGALRALHVVVPDWPKAAQAAHT